jgi:signal transduction histidine kinase
VIGAATPSQQALCRALADEFDVEAVPEAAALRHRAHRAIDVAVLAADTSGIEAALRDRPDTRDAPILMVTDAPHDSDSLSRLRDGLEDRVPSTASPGEAAARAAHLALVKRARCALRATNGSGALSGLSGPAAAERNGQDRAARETAEAASRAKDEFLAVLAHELRTPLNAVLGWVGILRRQGVTGDDFARGLAVIDRSARAQARLIEDVLEVSAMMRRKVELTLGPVLVRPVLVQALDAIRPAADAKRIGIHDAGEEDGIAVLADPQRLLQVLGNLMGNAVKFTPEGGRVTVDARAEEDTVVVRVADTGVGIAAEFLPRIFDEFTQAVNPLTERPRGLGLGLAIARHLVELQGGRLEAASPGIGLGATFTMRLPLLHASPVPGRRP